MSDEVLAEAPAPEQVATAAPEPEIAAPVEAQPESPKSFSQEELDAAIGKRLAREQRKWEREARQAEGEAAGAGVGQHDAFDEHLAGRERGLGGERREGEEREADEASDPRNCAPSRADFSPPFGAMKAD